MRAELRRARYGYLLAVHLLLLCAAGRTPSEVAAVLFCSRSSVYRIVRAYRAGTLTFEEASEQADEFAKERSLAEFFDEVAIPALLRAQVDSDDGVLLPERRTMIKGGVRAMLEDLSDDVAVGRPTPGDAASSEIEGAPARRPAQQKARRTAQKKAPRSQPPRTPSKSSIPGTRRRRPTTGRARRSKMTAASGWRPPRSTPTSPPPSRRWSRPNTRA